MTVHPAEAELFHGERQMNRHRHTWHS